MFYHFGFEHIVTSIPIQVYSPTANSTQFFTTISIIKDWGDNTAIYLIIQIECDCFPRAISNLCWRICGLIIAITSRLSSKWLSETLKAIVNTFLTLKFRRCVCAPGRMIPAMLKIIIACKNSSLIQNATLIVQSIPNNISCL